jgi:hypothetical protein
VRALAALRRQGAIAPLGGGRFAIADRAALERVRQAAGGG